jgi:RNA polymerase sigma-70 factor (ECF subfamily)
MSDDRATDSGVADDTVEMRARARRGDRAAFQALYDRIAPSLYAWTQLRVRGVQTARLDPDDLLQEVWLRALRGLDGYDPSLSFRGWIFGIAKHVILQNLRSSSRVVAGQLTSHRRSSDSLDFPESVTSICSRLAKDDLVQRFLAYVAGLPAEERQLVLYCGLEGQSSAQAAARLGILPDTALKRWQSLRERLREGGTLRALQLDEGV